MNNQGFFDEENGGFPSPEVEPTRKEVSTDNGYSAGAGEINAVLDEAIETARRDFSPHSAAQTDSYKEEPSAFSTAPQQTGYRHAAPADSYRTNGSGNVPQTPAQNPTPPIPIPYFTQGHGSSAPHTAEPTPSPAQQASPEMVSKKKKKQPSPNKGIKVFAIVMSILFLVSAATFTGYAILKENEPKQDNPITNSSRPSLNIGNTPGASSNSGTANGLLSTADIYDKLSPSVVGISVYVQTVGYQLAGQGSGVIMSEDGYVITNCHVVTDLDNGQEIAKIEVIMITGESYTATLVGADRQTDLAVLKINASNLTPAEFGDSDMLRVGDRVVVIGNPTGIDYAGSLTQGVVSALNRRVYMSQLGTEMEFIQTDAAINPGNSGGAFINEYGQVVGISSAKLVSEGVESMGFAIPINNAQKVIDSLIENGYVAGRPQIGILYTAIPDSLAELNGIPKGLRVVDIQSNSDALAKGLQKGDIITKIDGQDVYDTETISAIMEKKVPGDSLEMTVYRIDNTGKESTFTISVLLSEQSPDA